MTLRECYAALEGDYESAVARLMTERVVQKFIIRFLDDASYELLCRSIEEEDYNEAFRAAHTLKGVCQNLSFTKLYESSARLTEALRGGKNENAFALFPQVKADYDQTVSAIRTFQTEN